LTQTERRQVPDRALQRATAGVSTFGSNRGSEHVPIDRHILFACSAAVTTCLQPCAGAGMRFGRGRPIGQEFEHIDDDLLDFLQSRPGIQYMSWAGYYHHGEHQWWVPTHSIPIRSVITACWVGRRSQSTRLRRACCREVPEDMEEFSEAEWQFKLHSILNSLSSTSDLLTAVKLASISTLFDCTEEVRHASLLWL